MDHPILALEHARCQALERGDVQAVEPLLADGLVYAHSTGLVHDKKDLLDFIATRIRFDSVRRAKLVVDSDGDTAWMTGLLQIRGALLAADTPIASTTFVTQLWRRRQGAWQLAILQSTNVDPGMWDAA